ncbi:MAG: hypothetical protein A2W19_11410 [Spirochaetes bacterium RBG_16_49_21]|nr:MAG: hypothetical protein A2W19_11410 [Spirochaetes bacterium RBG_16_49_21]
MKIAKSFIAAACLAAMMSCAKDYRQFISAPEEKFYRGQQLEAARMLLPNINQAGKDQLLFMMEAGYALHIAEKYEDSNKVFLRAAQIAQVKPISISQEVGALLTDQTATNYRGEDFEKVLIHMYLGINYLMLRSFEDAAVEFKAVNNELQKIKAENGESRYKQNIMAKYLAAISHELRADVNASEEDREYAAVEYRQILQLKPELSMTKNDLTYLQSPKNSQSGELVIIFQSGRTPVKVSRGKLLDDSGMKASVAVAISMRNLAAGVTAAAVMASLAAAENPIPRFKIQSNKTKFVKVTVLSQQVATEMLENIEYTAMKNLEDDYGRLRAKVAASIVTKTIVSIAAGIVAQEVTRKLSGGNKLLSLGAGLLVGAGTGAALFATMRPDLRCWHFLPATLQLARMRLMPGKYTAKVQYIGFNGAVLDTKYLNLEIRKKDKYFMNLRTLE